MDKVTESKMVIKFSNYYYKLGTHGKKLPDRQALLLQVLTVNLEDLSKNFIEYDTSFPGGNYKLPKKGKYLLLIFVKFPSYLGESFMTLRRYTTKKDAFYRKYTGEWFDIIMGKE